MTPSDVLCPELSGVLLEAQGEPSKCSVVGHYAMADGKNLSYQYHCVNISIGHGESFMGIMCCRSLKYSNLIIEFNI